MAEPPPDATRKKTTFLSLPWELREQILIHTLALYGPASTSGTVHAYSKKPRGCLWFCTPTLKALRATNRQISSEALKIYFGRRHFVIDIIFTEKKFCGSALETPCVCDEKLAAVRDLEVEFLVSGLLSVNLKRVRGDWSCNLSWEKDTGESYTCEDAMTVEEKQALTTQIEELCAGISGGLSFSDFAAMRAISGFSTMRAIVEHF